MIDWSKEGEIIEALRGYRTHVPGAYALFAFLADIENRVGGAPDSLSVKRLAEEQGSHPSEVLQLYVFLDQLGLVNFMRRRQLARFLMDPVWIGFNGLIQEEQEEFDNYYGYCR